MTTLSVKWGKETHSVSVTAACASGAQIKAALAAATGVPATRQKVMSKAWKGVLADDADVLAGCLALAPTAPVPATLMGSAEAGVSRPSGATQPVRSHLTTMPSEACLYRRSCAFECLTLSPRLNYTLSRRFLSRT